MRIMRFLPVVMLQLLAGSQRGTGQPFTLQGPGVNTNEFRVTVFASGLNYPLGMARLADDSLLVTVSQSVNFYVAPSQLLRLTDTNLDGVADDVGTVLYTGLPASSTAVRVAGNLILVAGNGRPISVLRAGTTPASPLTLVGQLLFTYPNQWSHLQSALAVRRSPGFTNRYEMIFQIGSDVNFAASTRTVALTNSNLPGVGGVLAGDSIYQLTLIDDGAKVTTTNLIQLASGLRNPAGFTFHPATGDLYFEDNGIDGLVNANEPHSADELNFIARTNLGGAPEFFGCPSNYVAYRTGTVIGGAGVAPLIAFQPIPDPFTGAESEGPNDVVFAPPGFPDGLNTGVFVGFHGRFDLGGTNNEENPLVFANPATGAYFHFIHGQQAGIGHLDGLLATRDSLFVADLVTSGKPSSGAGAGVIYQIKSLVNPPPVLTARRVGGQLELTWDRGTLQQADAVSGPWRDVPDAFSPLLTITAGQKQFYRVGY